MKSRKKINFKILIILWLLFCFLVFSFIFFKANILKSEPKKIYEVLVMVRSQKNPNIDQDKKTSLKKGDVLLLQKPGHKWSRGEKVSYLILRMKLTKKQAEKLVQAKTKKLSKKEIQQKIEEELKNSKQEFQNAKFDEKQQKKIIEEKIKSEKDVILAREYRINLEKYFPDFKAIDLLKGQPFINKIYDWKIVEKKK